MRISIGGGQGTGKTTLAQKLSEHFKLQLIPDIADIMIRNYLMSIKNNTKENTFLLFQKKAIEEKIEMEKKFDSFISDTSVVDYFAVTMIFAKNMASKNFLHLKERVQKAAMRYNTIIVIPSGKFTLQENGKRSSDYMHQWRRYVILVGWLTLWNIPWFPVYGNRAEERFREVLDWMEKNRWVS